MDQFINIVILVFMVLGVLRKLEAMVKLPSMQERGFGSEQERG